VAALGIALFLAGAMVVLLVTGVARRPVQPKGLLYFMRRVPRMAIADVGDGVKARLVGKVVATELLSSPLTGTPCVFFQVVVHMTGRELPIIREQVGVSFAIVEDGARAVVDPDHAELSLVFAGKHSSGTFNQPTAAEKALLDKHKVRYQGLALDEQLWYHEAVIAPGETITVCGQGVRDADPQAVAGGLYRDPPPTLLSLRGSPAEPLLISNDPDLLG
jgi:hypothetical protein